jgi:hypothetical protein
VGQVSDEGTSEGRREPSLTSPHSLGGTALANLPISAGRRRPAGYVSLCIQLCVAFAIALTLAPAASADSSGQRRVLSELAAQDWVDDDDSLYFEGAYRAIRSAHCHGLGLRYPFGAPGRLAVPGYEDFRCDVVLLLESGGVYRRLTIWVHLLQKRTFIPHFHFSFQAPKPNLRDQATPHQGGISYCREFGRTRIEGLYSLPKTWPDQRVANEVATTAFQPIVLRKAFAEGCLRGLATR